MPSPRRTAADRRPRHPRSSPFVIKVARVWSGAGFCQQSARGARVRRCLTPGLPSNRGSPGGGSARSARARGGRRVRRTARCTPGGPGARARRVARAGRDPSERCRHAGPSRGARSVPALLRARPRSGRSTRVRGAGSPGKCQVFIAPEDDHLRTRLTHAVEVAQVATGIARVAGLCVPLTEAIALAHDCGHGPAGPRVRGGVLAVRARRLRPRGLRRRRHARAAQPVRSRRSTACATTRGAGPRRRPPRARSSPGPTASRTSATTSRTRCAPGILAPDDLPDGDRRRRRPSAGRGRSARSWTRCSRRSTAPGTSG